MKQKFIEKFGAHQNIEIFSSPGRVELCGNHTDHQGGRALAAAIGYSATAAAARTSDNIIRIFSEGYDVIEIEVSDLAMREEEKNSTASLIRGVCNAVAERGFKLSGMSAYVTSDVPKGSGLSSSACFETLIAQMLNHFFCEGKLTAIECAQIGQFAENEYFGKPSGILDQLACAVGGVTKLDFKSDEPGVCALPISFERYGYTLCMIVAGGDHADLTGDYAAVTYEMRAVSNYFGKARLCDVAKGEFYSNIPDIRQKCGDRAVLRAMHYYAECERVDSAFDALSTDRFDLFLEQVLASGRSSFQYLQNVSTYRTPEHQELAVALALCDEYLCGHGAYRVHGGGFAGTVLAFVENDYVKSFKDKIESVLGADSCQIMKISEYGARHI